jgi:hypothetical protein
VLKATQEEYPSLVDEGSHQWGLTKMDHFAKVALVVDAELLLREQCVAILVFQVSEHDLEDYLVVESYVLLGASWVVCWYF